MLRAQEDVTCVMQKHISLSFVKARVGLGYQYHPISSFQPKTKNIRRGGNGTRRCAHFLFEAFRETLCFSTYTGGIDSANYFILLVVCCF